MIINTDRLITKLGNVQVSETICNLEVSLDLAYEMGKDTDSLRGDLAFMREWERTVGGDPLPAITFLDSEFQNSDDLILELNTDLLTFSDRAELICGLI